MAKISGTDIVKVTRNSNVEVIPENSAGLHKPLEAPPKKNTELKCEAKIDTLLEERRSKSWYNNKAFLTAEYTSFGLAMGSTALGCVALNNFAALVSVFFGAAIILFLLAVFTSLIAQHVIKAKRLGYKLAPHVFISGFALSLVYIFFSVIVAFIAALITGDVTITIIAATLTFVSLMLITFTKL